MADFTDLDWAFTCPESITDEDLRMGYECLVARCRAEGAHLATMNTPYQLLIERTINAYIKAKQTERREYGTPGGFEHPGQEKDFNIFVLKLLHELNDMLRRDHPTADQEFVVEKIRRVIIEALGGIPDASTREDLARRLAVAFEANGL